MSSCAQIAVEYNEAPTLVSVEQPQWYAIRTRSRCEKMVSEQLQLQGIENFLPLVKRVHKWSDRMKQVELPLFSGYTFVRITQTSPERLQVLKAHGVAGFVGIHGVGIAIPENQIRDIRTLIENNVAFEEKPFFKVGQRVRIKGGCLDGVEGVLAGHKGDESLMISVEPIQRSLSIRIQGYSLEAA
jgi:transcription termination/antitermination protein NusG